MKYFQVPRTELSISKICLGTMTFGGQNTEAQAHEQMDYALDQGINFFDTAELYAFPSSPKVQGLTEKYIGSWFTKHQNRHKIILASKVASRGEISQHIREDIRLNKAHIDQAVYGSLKRLQTDYIDLYQVHWPERPTNFFGKLGYQYPNEDSQTTPIFETLEALQTHVKAGRVRYIGVSNETPWGVSEYLRLSEKYSLPRIISIQNPYNLLNRSYEIGLAEFTKNEDVGLLAYSPLGFGILSGKYLNGQSPQGSRLNLYGHKYKRYSNAQAVAATDAYVELAQKHQLNPAQMALAFVNQQPFIFSNIIGATQMEQLKTNVESIYLTLTEEVLREIEAIHKQYPFPAP